MSNSEKQIANQTPVEVLRELVNDGQLEMGRIAHWIDVHERTVRFWLAEYRGGPDHEQLLIIRRELRRDGKRAIALRLSRAECPDYAVSEHEKPTLKELDRDSNGAIDTRDSIGHSIDLAELVVQLQQAVSEDNYLQCSRIHEAIGQCLRLSHGAAEHQLLRGARLTCSGARDK